MRKRFTKRNIIKFLISLFVLGVILVKYAICVQHFYPAQKTAKAYMENPPEGVIVTQDTNTIVFTKEDAKTGFIFYPGAYVDPEAYAPLMVQLAENDIKCIVMKMPHYLAMLKINAARGIEEQHPEVERWYIGGHSLGGAMASFYGAKHQGDYEGLVFLGAYASNDLTDKDIEVLIVRGTEDKVINEERYEECHHNLPRRHKDTFIQGGCHSYFGDYGIQIGDGTPTITMQEQIDQTCAAILRFINYD